MFFKLIIKAGEIKNDNFFLPAHRNRISFHRVSKSDIFYLKKMLLIFISSLSFSQLLCICIQYNTLIIYYALYNNTSYNNL